MKAVEMEYGHGAPRMKIRAGLDCSLFVMPSSRQPSADAATLWLSVTREILWAIDANRERIEDELARCEATAAK